MLFFPSYQIIQTVRLHVRLGLVDTAWVRVYFLLKSIGIRGRAKAVQSGFTPEKVKIILKKG